MPTYSFQMSAGLAGSSVSVTAVGSSTVVASGTLDTNALFTASLPVGDYVAKAADGHYSYSSAGTVAASDPDQMADLYSSQRGRQSFDAVNYAALRPWFAALANRDNAAADILVIGDSISEGEGASSIGTRWVARMRDLLRSRFPAAGVTGGVGYIAGYYALTNPSGQGFTAAGTTSNNPTYGLGRRQKSLNSNGTLTITVTCSSFDVVYTQGGSNFTVTIDGGTAQAVNASGTTTGGAKWNSGPLTPGSHTVLITSQGSFASIEGIMVYNGDEAKGIRVWDGSHYGYAANDFNSNSNWPQSITAAAPELVLLTLGNNDYNNARTAATFKTDMATLVSTVRSKAPSAAIALVAMHERGATKTEPYSAYVQKLYDLAVEDGNLAVFDFTTRLPKAQTATANALGIYADEAHPNTKGHALIADTLTSFLSPR